MTWNICILNHITNTYFTVNCGYSVEPYIRTWDRVDSPGSVSPTDDVPDVTTVVPQQGAESDSPGSVTLFEDSQEKLNAPLSQHDTESSSVDDSHKVKS